MQAALETLRGLDAPSAVLLLTLANIVQFGVSLLVGRALVRLFEERPLGQPAPPIDRFRIGTAAFVVFLNSSVAWVGWYLWRDGWLVIRADVGVRALLDVAVLFGTMDIAMYLAHRTAHHPALFRWIHATHHRYSNPRPLDLFVLSPMEVWGYGTLWLLVLWVYPASMLGILVYLSLNLIFGTIGHLGVEPMADRTGWMFRTIGTSTFHAGHHRDGSKNFGFYLTVWDRLFGTLDLDAVHAEAPPEPGSSAA